MNETTLSLTSDSPCFPSSGIRTDTMLTVEQARRLTDAEPDIAELLRKFAEVDRHYREAVAAMSSPEREIEPVLNSAEITISFQTTPALIDMRNER